MSETALQLSSPSVETSGMILAELPVEDSLIALRQAIDLWAEATTDTGSSRRKDLLRDKKRVVKEFFAFIRKSPGEITPFDVKQWQANLEERGLKPASIYYCICRLSSFYQWALIETGFNNGIRANPARLAKPKPPKAYQTESARSLDDEQLQALVEVVAKKAAAGDIAAKRDYALLLFYIVTGLRREEVISLRAGDIDIKDQRLIVTCKVKGGHYTAREVADPSLKHAVIDYLASSGRLRKLTTKSPLWLRHDRGAGNEEALASQGFVKRLKAYAREAGIAHIHLHQTRHTFARVVAEETGSIVDVQDALGHKNQSTTRVYVQRIAVKKDKHSSQIMSRLKPLSEST